ncbi:MAG: hypothetical protein LBT55_02675 [Clostridiaceae bacterium]|jgi:hypothetical protein|nr:hypothetical protein [Clostridiaceae bacterium]
MIRENVGISDENRKNGSFMDEFVVSEADGKEQGDGSPDTNFEPVDYIPELPDIDDSTETEFVPDGTPFGVSGSGESGYGYLDDDDDYYVRKKPPEPEPEIKPATKNTPKAEKNAPQAEPNVAQNEIAAEKLDDTASDELFPDTEGEPPFQTFEGEDLILTWEQENKASHKTEKKPVPTAAPAVVKPAPVTEKPVKKTEKATPAAAKPAPTAKPTPTAAKPAPTTKATPAAEKPAPTTKATPTAAKPAQTAKPTSTAKPTPTAAKPAPVMEKPVKKTVQSAAPVAVKQPVQQSKPVPVAAKPVKQQSAPIVVRSVQTQPSPVVIRSIQTQVTPIATKPVQTAQPIQSISKEEVRVTPDAVVKTKVISGSAPAAQSGVFEMKDVRVQSSPKQEPKPATVIPVGTRLPVNGAPLGERFKDIDPGPGRYICEFCGTVNSNGVEICPACGKSRAQMSVLIARIKRKK